MNTNENLAPQVVLKLMKDIKKLCQNPPEGIKLFVNDDNVANITAELQGPEQTPFEGGVFRVKLVLGSDFPQSPPKGFFLTKVFHPNVSETGEICVNTLKKDWQPTHGLEHILLIIRCLLIHPNPESALNPDAGQLLLEDYEAFAKRASLMTRIHAKPKKASKKKSPEAEDDEDVAVDLSESKTVGSPSKKLKSTDSSSADGTVADMMMSTKPKLVKKKSAVPAKKAGLKRL